MSVPRLSEKMLGVRDFIDGMTLHTASERGALEMREEVCRRQIQAIARQAHLDCVGCPLIVVHQENIKTHTHDKEEIRTTARCKERDCIHIKIATRPASSVVSDYKFDPNEATQLETYTRTPPYEESVEMARARILDLMSVSRNPAILPGRQLQAEIMASELQRRTHPQAVERMKLLRDQEELAQAIEEATGKPLEQAIVESKPDGWGQW